MTRVTSFMISDILRCHSDDVTDDVSVIDCRKSASPPMRTAADIADSATGDGVDRFLSTASIIIIIIIIIIISLIADVRSFLQVVAQKPRLILPFVEFQRPIKT